MTLSDWIQLAAVMAAITASLSALWIAHADRRTARDIAAADRKAALLSQELDYAVRLARVTAYGGSTNRKLVNERGAERLALISVLSHRVPEQWKDFAKGASTDEIRTSHLNNEDALIAKRRNESIAVILDVLEELEEVRAPKTR